MSDFADWYILHGMVLYLSTFPTTSRFYPINIYILRRKSVEVCFKFMNDVHVDVT